MNYRPTPKEQQHYYLGCERISLTLTLIPIGKRDLSCTLFGGQAHIGAVAVGAKNEVDQFEINLIEVYHHREGPIAKYICQELCQAYGCSVVTTVGIHFDKITKKEIDIVCDLSKKLLLSALDQ